MKFLKDSLYPLLKLAIPLAITGVLQSSAYFFETLFLAHLGTKELAAGGLVSWLFGTFIVIIIGVLSSINILVSHKHGAKDDDGIALVVRDGVWLALLLFIPSFILFWNLSPVFILLGQNKEVVALAETYLRALAWGLLPDLIMFALLQYIVGLGSARVILLFSLMSVSLTVFFSYSLIFGRFGFPTIGFAGAGWGTTLSLWISALCVIIFILTKAKYRAYLRYLFKPGKASYIKELITVGAPMGIMYCVEVGFFFALTLIAGFLGSQILAANQIALQYMTTLMSLAFSVAQAVTVRMGHLLGAGEIHAAKKASYTGVLLTGIFMTLIAFIFWFMPTLLVSIDFDIYAAKNFELVKFATQLLMISAVFQIFESMRITFFGALRALKDTRFTLYVSIFSFWLLALPLGYWLEIRFHLNGAGLWWGMVVGAVFSVFALLWRFNFKINNGWVVTQHDLDDG